jgi:acyl carrier protein
MAIGAVCFSLPSSDCSRSLKAMTTDEIRQTVLRLLGDVAPEADPVRIRPDINLRDQLDIDSMDFLNFAVSLHNEFRLEIPERDYPQLSTIDGCISYVQRSGLNCHG